MKKLISIALLSMLINTNISALPSPPLNGAYPIADVDQDGNIAALSDGLLMLRYLFGFRGESLIDNNIVSSDCTRCSADQLGMYLSTTVESKVLDCDDNDTVTPLTDGLLFIRFLLGFTGDTLINNIVGAGAQSTTATALQSCLGTLTHL